MTTSRKTDIDSLILRSRRDFSAIKEAYETCLHTRTISSGLKIDIKNYCENLRSVLDYIAHDIRDKYCPSAGANTRFYFPILPDSDAFGRKTNEWYPGLVTSNSDIWNYLESVQPYHTDFTWLGKFNRLNNENKHECLVEQTSRETHRVSVSFNSGSVKWNPNAVKFGQGVSIGGVPVDPQTQMPIPHPSQEIERIVWVDFRFEGIDESAIGLMSQSLDGISNIAHDVYELL